jgi:hypothetical protein
MEKPVYFIVAQPRGASSLLQQLLISNLEVGYVTNFLAKYYDDHKKGLKLEEEILDKNFKSTFLSNYGNTDGLNEPHEWGWFWQDKLNLTSPHHYSDDIDFNLVKQSMNDITAHKKLPLIIDNIYAMANLMKLNNNMNNVKMINLTRDLYFICNSIINARLSRYNDINQFYGHPPANIDEILKIKNPIEQIVMQVKSIQDEIDLTIKSFDEKDVLNIDYEEIYKDSFDIVTRFHDFVKQDGFELKYKEKHIPILSYRNDPSLIKDTYKDKLDFYYEKYFGDKR